MLKSRKNLIFNMLRGITVKIYDYNGKKNISGERIREARLRLRLSQADLAAKWIIIPKKSRAKNNPNFGSTPRFGLFWCGEDDRIRTYDLYHVKVAL